MEKPGSKLEPLTREMEVVKFRPLGWWKLHRGDELLHTFLFALRKRVERAVSSHEAAHP